MFGVCVLSSVRIYCNRQPAAPLLWRCTPYPCLISPSLCRYSASCRRSLYLQTGLEKCHMYQKSSIFLATVVPLHEKSQLIKRPIFDGLGDRRHTRYDSRIDAQSDSRRKFWRITPIISVKSHRHWPSMVKTRLDARSRTPAYDTRATRHE